MQFDMLVNKEQPLDENFIPENLVNTHSRSVEADKDINGNNKPDVFLVSEAFNAFKEMQAEALKNSLDIEIDSGYRDYQHQQRLFDKYYAKDGEDSLTYVALPGTSEHQTGLAIDLCIFEHGVYNDEVNDQMAEIKWVHDNCYKYGFILRFPKSKTEVTGYKYEPWHIRYVGREIATFIYKNNLTLEEYHKN